MTAVTMDRPPKWDSWLPEGERLPDDAWEAHPDPDWTADHPFIGRPCRFGSPANGYCGRPSVAVLFRGRFGGRRIPYTYCERHMYGRWIENGQVLDWRVIAEEPCR